MRSRRSSWPSPTSTLVERAENYRIEYNFEKEETLL